MKILYFASLREKIGKGEDEIDSVETTDKLLELLKNKYPNCFDDSVITAVNMEVVRENTDLKNSDEIAFYPPVTGG